MWTLPSAATVLGRKGFGAGNAYAFTAQDIVKRQPAAYASRLTEIREPWAVRHRVLIMSASRTGVSSRKGVAVRRNSRGVVT